MYGALNDTDYLGTYDSYSFDGTVGDTGFFIGECLNMSDENNNITYNLTALGEVGEYIDINFSGSYEDYQGNAHTINGVVHVLRDN